MAGTIYKATATDSATFRAFVRIVEDLGNLGDALAESTEGDPDIDPLYKLSQKILTLRDEATEVFFAAMTPEDQAKVQAQFTEWVK